MNFVRLHRQHQGHNPRHQAAAAAKAQVVRGPQPGTLVGEGTHRMVIRVWPYYAPPGQQLPDKIKDNDIQQQSRRRRRFSYCRYTVTVLPAGRNRTESACQPPAAPHHGQVVCSVKETATICRYLCDDGYVAPKSHRHLIQQEWPCRSLPATPPECIRKKI